MDMEPVNQPVSTNSNFLVTLLSVLLLLAVGAAGFFAWQTQNLVKQLTELQSVNIQPAFTPSPQPTTDPTADWETYKTSVYQIKYPPDLEIKEENGGVVYFTKWGPTQKGETELYDAISISLQTKKDNLTTEEYAKAKIEEVKTKGISTIQKGLETIDIGIYKGHTYTIFGLGIHRSIILSSQNGIIVEITDSTQDPTNQGFSAVVDQILSTFEFIDTETSSPTPTSSSTSSPTN